MKGNC